MPFEIQGIGDGPNEKLPLAKKPFPHAPIVVLPVA